MAHRQAVAPSADATARAGEVLRRLQDAYGPVAWQPRMAPLDELVFTILTQHTSDVNAGKAFRQLRERFPRWEDLLEAPLDAIEEAIRVAGLGRQKALRIQEALRGIMGRRGLLELDFLRDMPLEEAKAWLRALPGVGPKTAAIVLCFALGRPAMPVDTHVHRVARRLGLLHPKDNAEKAHALLEGMVAPEQVYPFHVYLITHGRRVCKAQRPRCGECVLRDMCPSRRV
ncbi:MAG: endonuclease III [Dehalococcoidia bacterium]|nr:endonuclease III [Dehalococcoidia bacterium]MDW8119500.1 endonuclease III [Chloroflexota bacterium]